MFAIAFLIVDLSYDVKYGLSTIIFVIHKVFYESENGQTKGSKGQIAGYSGASQAVPGGKQGHFRRCEAFRGVHLRLGAENLAFGSTER
jgi:hypothetical protein